MTEKLDHPTFCTFLTHTLIQYTTPSSLSPLPFLSFQSLLCCVELQVRNQGGHTANKSNQNMAALATAEICDTNAAHITSGELRILHPVFQVYGQAKAFSGQIVTLKVFEDNVLVREMLETKGEGRVLVIDGGGSMRCALVGGNLGQLAQSMGWSGIVVNGCIRDVDEINGCDVGVRALASHPLKSNKRGNGEKHVPIYVAGAFIRDGEWLYADTDGVLVSKFELSI